MMLHWVARLVVGAGILLSVTGAQAEGDVAPMPAAPAAPMPAAPAAPVHHARAHRHHASWHKPGVAPLAAAPAQRVASTTSPAPIPNESVSPPDAPPPKAEISPRSFQLHYPPVGDGYVTGSSSQAMDDREAAKATGVQMTVPLPQ